MKFFRTKFALGLYALTTIAIATAFAANVNISDLPVASSTAGADLFETEQSGTNRQTTGTKIATYINSLFSGAFTCTSGGVCTLAAASSAVFPFPVSINSAWYPPYVGAGITNGVVQSVNTIYCTYGLMPAVKFGALGVTITTPGTAVQAAVYDNTGTLVANTGNITATGAASVNAALSGGNVTVTAGGYWFCTNSNNAATVLESYNGTTNTTAAFLGSATQANASGSALIIGRSFASAFNTWPGTLTLASGTDVTSRQIPVVVYQAVVP